MSRLNLHLGKRGAFGCLHMRPQLGPRVDARHRRDVVSQHINVDDHCRRGQLMNIYSADGETRTLTGGVLSAVPLPLGYVGQRPQG